MNLLEQQTQRTQETKMTSLEELVNYLTLIKNDESDCSANASLDVWIECMEGEYAEVPEVAEYVALKQQTNTRG